MKHYFIKLLGALFTPRFVTTTKTPPEPHDTLTTISGAIDSASGRRDKPEVHVPIVTKSHGESYCEADASFQLSQSDVYVHHVSTEGGVGAKVEAMRATADTTADDVFISSMFISAKAILRSKISSCLEHLEEAIREAMGDDGAGEADGLSAVAASYINNKVESSRQYHPYRVVARSALHPSVRQARCGFNPIMSGAYGPCCRSFLAAPHCDDADDDPMSL